MLLASLVFYSCWELKDLYLFLIAILANFALSKLFRAGASHQKKILAVGISLNLLFLAYFKYFDFFVENASVFWGGIHNHRQLILPLGISFYTFQQIAYLIDAYRVGGRSDSLLDYTLFISFFPQLIAGPILHHNEFIPQMKEKKTYIFDGDNFTHGLCLLSLGLFKKVAIADTLGIFVNKGYAGTQSLTSLDAWVTSISFTFQSYFDFSGYSDMALGLGLFFNLQLPANFDNPFRATNISEFWRRWHMTLTRLFEGYLYFPLALRLLR
ncbi:MAG: MBOAT family O-acyltransferase, partial [Bacteriovoracaceae bacterium]